MFTSSLQATFRGWLGLLVAVSLLFARHTASAADPVPKGIAPLIDREIDQRLQAEKLPVSARSSDGEFCRRVYIDIIGRIPTYDEIVAFLDSKDPKKRAKLVDNLLARPEYGQHWATIWTNLSVARSDSSQLAINFHRLPFHQWLARRLNANNGWDWIVTALLTAEGPVQEVPEAAFLLSYSGNNLQPQPERIAGAVSELFLGIQLKCAECHNHRGSHPVNRWKHKDFWAMAAFFGRLRTQAAAKDTAVTAKTILTEREVPKKKALGDNTFAAPRPILPGGLLEVPDPGNSTRFLPTPVKARFLEAEEPDLPANGPYRPQLAAWLTSPRNPYFAPALVNRLWGHFLGRGLVNPIDEMHPDNPPSHPQLLRQLSEAFTASGYDLKDLIRGIANSEAYQRSSRVLPDNAKDRQWLSHALIKPLRPEVLFDSLQVATNGSDYGPPPVGAKDDSRSPRETFAQFFGNKQWSNDPAEMIYGVPHFLRLMNVGDGGPVFTKLTAPADQEKVIENLYLAALSRRPTATEIAAMKDHVKKAPDARTGYCEVYWALLNSAEFLLNH